VNLRRRLPVFVAGVSLCARALSAQTAPSQAVPPDSAGAAAAVFPQDRGAEDPGQRPDTRTQYPWFLANSYFSVNVGYLQYDFSNRELEPGFRAASVDIPHVAARVVLFGHQFNRFLSAQVAYMRPVNYITYHDVNDDQSPHHVLVHFGSATLRPQVPVHRRLSIFGEAGLGVTSRRGFAIDGIPAVTEANLTSLLTGGGIDVHLTPTIDLVAGMTYSPRNDKHQQPKTLLWTGGFRFNMLPLSDERVAAKAGTDARFPANVVQAEYTFGVGYGVNTFLSETVPIFWGGEARVDRGGAIHYQHNVFHTARVFSLDIGTSASVWSSRVLDDSFYTLSVYPLLRWTLVRTAPADLYFAYSLAGPTYISKIIIDGLDTGRHFTFQDFMEAGGFIGKGRWLSAGIKINHYSNGNIFTQNAGVKVPLTVYLGYAWK
jgi:Lipid A 3-O-deacylase (PagL)